MVQAVKTIRYSRGSKPLNATDKVDSSGSDKSQTTKHGTYLTLWHELTNLTK